MDDVINILESHPTFKNISARLLLALTEESELVHLKKGEIVYAEHKPSENAYMVVHGACEASPGYGVDTLHTFGVGAIFGDRGLLKNRQRKNTVTAITDTVLLRMSGERFREMMAENDKVVHSLRDSRQPANLYYDEGAHRFRLSEKTLAAFVNFTGFDLENTLLYEVAHAVFEVAGKPVLLLNLREDEHGIELDSLDQNIQRLCEETTDRAKREVQLPFLMGEIKLGKDERAFSRLVPLFDTCSRHFPFIIVVFHGERMSPTKRACLDYAMQTYVVTDQSGFSRYAVKELFSQQSADWRKKTRSLLLLDRNEPIFDNESLKNQVGVPVDSYIHLHAEDIMIPQLSDVAFEREKRYRAQFRRLAREIARCRVGVALSSGAAKGLAHVGVIQYLEKIGVEVDMIAGTSIGSYVAACWAYGYDGRAMEKLAMEYNRPRGVWDLLDPTFPPRIGVIRGNKVESRLRQILDDVEFSELSIPLRIVLTNLDTLEAEVVNTGDVARAVCASCTLPGIVEPRMIGNMRYVDGGITDPLPVDVLEAEGIENIIAVSTVMTGQNARECYLNLRTTPRHGRWRKFLGKLNKHVNYFARGNVFDTLMRSFEASQIRLVEQGLLQADVLIQPVECNAVWHEFTRPAKYIALGRRAAEAHAEALKAITKTQAPS